jgi:hypothetical protein
MKKARGWTPMQRGHYRPLTQAQIDEHIRLAGIELTPEQVIEQATDDEVWLNDLYQCAVAYLDQEGPLGRLHLSIKRRDKQPVRDWRALQMIKNDVAGPEREAVELFPAESRRIDTANQYHLWVEALGRRIPVGYNGPRVVSDDVGATGARQRPL